MMGPAELRIILFLILFGGLLVVLPFWKIFAKAGFSGWLSIIMLIPYLNIIMLFYFAFSKWPAHKNIKVDQLRTKQNSIGLIISLIVSFSVFAFIILKLFLGDGNNSQQRLSPYVSFEEAKKIEAPVQIKGVRVEGSENYNIEGGIFNFKLVDDISGEEFQVIYHGVKPLNFENAKQVVAIGRYHDGKFEANHLLVKCPSKYEAETGDGSH